MDIGFTGGYDSLLVSRQGNDLVLNSFTTYEPVNTPNTYYDNVRIQSYFLGARYQVENLILGDGTQTTLAARLAQGYEYQGSTQNDIMIGNANTIGLYGLAGDDTLTGSARNDQLYGGEGQDSLTGAAGNDYLSGGGGNDILNGGSGNDYLNGNTGDDIYEFGRGYGLDQVTDYASDKSTIKLVGLNSTDTNVKFERVKESYSNPGDYTLRITIDQSDSLTFKYWWGTQSNNSNRLVQFDDVTLNFADIDNRLSVIAATSGNDIMLGTNRDDSIAGLNGNDTIYGFEGNDTLNGNDGWDNLYGGEGDDYLYGGAGFNKLDGGAGADIMDGSGSGNNYFYVDNAGDQVIGSGTIYSSLANYTLLTSTYYSGIVIQEGGAWSATGNESSNSIIGNGQSNLIMGMGGNDNLSGGNGGNDILQGGAGIDYLDASGWYVPQRFNRVLDGGDDNDTLRSIYYGLGEYQSNDLLVGGKGSDVLYAGAYEPSYEEDGSVYPEYFGSTGYDILTYNAGDGQDMVYAGGGAKLTLSLGGGIEYSNLAFHKSGSDLVLETGGTDSITFYNWYETVPYADTKSVLNLQVIAEAMNDFAPGGSDVLRDNKIETFSFIGLVNRFDQALAANSSLTSWELTNALLDSHLSGSDTDAIGGDLAYQYGMNGTLSGIGLNAAQSVISNAQFGLSAQTLHAASTWQSEMVKLG